MEQSEVKTITYVISDQSEKQQSQEQSALQKRTQKKRANRARATNEADYYLHEYKAELKHGDYDDHLSLKPKKNSYVMNQSSKKSYMRGNFNFLMNPAFEQEIRFLAPDATIPWDQVEQVKYITNLNIHCPICLNELDGIVAPQITLCGHIYCWPCILRHLSCSKGKFSSRCPLCSDVILEKDLKSADVQWVAPLITGEPIKLKLLKRNKNDYAILEANSFEENYTFRRIKKLTYQDIMKIHLQEIKVMKQLLKEFEEQDDEKEHQPFILTVTCIVWAGVCLYDNWQAIVKAQDLLKIAEDKLSELPGVFKQKSKQEIGNYAESKEEDFSYFYQESNGLNIFLSPLCYKHLQDEYPSCFKMPLEIQSDLLESEGLLQSDKTRKKHKCLGHIPLNSDIKFATLDMKALLSNEKNRLYEEELKAERERNQSVETTKPVKSNASSLKTSPACFPLSQNELYKKYGTTPSLTGLRLDDDFDYPELSATDSLGSRTQSEKTEYYFEGQQNAVLKGTEVDLGNYQKKDEDESIKDYLVKENEADAKLSDFIFIRTKQKKSKSKKQSK